jgi:hypothetical protein
MALDAHPRHKVAYVLPIHHLESPLYVGMNTMNKAPNMWANQGVGKIEPHSSERMSGTCTPPSIQPPGTTIAGQLYVKDEEETPYYVDTLVPVCPCFA